MDNGNGSTSALRPDMVEAARKFLSTPKVRESPWEEQRQFLLGKGVTQAEIDEARASLPALPDHPMHHDQRPIIAPQQNRFVSFAQSAVFVGAVSYAGYRFLRSYILPKFFDIPDPAEQKVCFVLCPLASSQIQEVQLQLNELQNSMKFVIDSVSQTTRTYPYLMLAHVCRLGMQQEEISKALISLGSRDTDLSRIDQGICAIRGLLLNANSFAPIQTSTAVPAVNMLPSWQITSASKQMENGVAEHEPLNAMTEEPKLDEEFHDAP